MYLPYEIAIGSMRSWRMKEKKLRELSNEARKRSERGNAYWRT